MDQGSDKQSIKYTFWYKFFKRRRKRSIDLIALQAIYEENRAVRIELYQAIKQCLIRSQ